VAYRTQTRCIAVDWDIEGGPFYIEAELTKSSEGDVPALGLTTPTNTRLDWRAGGGGASYDAHGGAATSEGPPTQIRGFEPHHPSCPCVDRPALAWPAARFSADRSRASPRA
jgi:hypothetical protein